MVDICYPPDADWSCAYSAEELAEMLADPETATKMERSDALAWMMLQSLTAFRLSLCPVILRPCLARCVLGTWDTAPVQGGSFQPFISGGQWYNGCGCRTDDCSCTSLCQVNMPAEVGKISAIWLNGGLIDPTAYRVDDGTKLVRTDGDCWPSCQDMTNSDPADGGFFVSYYPGVAPNDLFRYAAGLLAVEFFKACEGGDCRLPTGVTNIARAGVSISMEGVTFPGGMSGIPEVDSVVRIYNPNGLKGPSRILSPDRRRGRTQTWSV